MNETQDKKSDGGGVAAEGVTRAELTDDWTVMLRTVELAMMSTGTEVMVFRLTPSGKLGVKWGGEEVCRFADRLRSGWPVSAVPAPRSL